MVKNFTGEELMKVSKDIKKIVVCFMACEDLKLKQRFSFMARLSEISNAKNAQDVKRIVK